MSLKSRLAVERVDYVQLLKATVQSEAATQLRLNGRLGREPKRDRGWTNSKQIKGSHKEALKQFRCFVSNRAPALSNLIGLCLPSKSTQRAKGEGPHTPTQTQLPSQHLSPAEPRPIETHSQRGGNTWRLRLVQHCHLTGSHGCSCHLIASSSLLLCLFSTANPRNTRSHSGSHGLSIGKERCREDP